jgi:hypothetical protein
MARASSRSSISHGVHQYVRVKTIEERCLYRTMSGDAHSRDAIQELLFERFERVGHRVRTLVFMADAKRPYPIELGKDHLKHFTNLKTLLIVPDRPPNNGGLQRELRSLPSLENLANLVLYRPALPVLLECL